MRSAKQVGFFELQRDLTKPVIQNLVKTEAEKIAYKDRGLVAVMESVGVVYPLATEL